MPDKLYTTNQLAKLFGVVPTTVIDWVERGKLRAFKTLGGHRRITHQAVLDFLAANQLPVPPALTSETPLVALMSLDAEWARATTRALERDLAPARLQSATHPIPALVAMGAERPDVVILDAHLGGWHAEEVARSLREHFGGDGFRILGLTTAAAEGVDPPAPMTGADAMVSRWELAGVADACRALLGATGRGGS
jgi:excisionase family DNA binding protein